MPILETGEMPLPNGATLTWQPNGAGGRTYYSDEIGGGCVVWDTCLVDESTLHAALNVEAMMWRAKDRELAQVESLRSMLENEQEACQTYKDRAYDLEQELSVQWRERDLLRKEIETLRRSLGGDA